jgi:phage shock protein C
MSRTSKNYKRLYRSRKDKMIAGVCGGLADYFKIDPSVIRIIFIAFLLFGGSALLVYLVMWFVIPFK